MSDEDRLLKLEADIAQLHAYMEQKAINIAGTTGAYLHDIFGRKFSVPVDAEHVKAAISQACHAVYATCCSTDCVWTP
eukprot:6200375-Pleurochrysis_carterae.AAC.1